MTPDNDKTLRGWFRPTRLGVDEWNDRGEYRRQHEEPSRLVYKLFLADKKYNILPFGIYPMKKDNIIDAANNKHLNETSLDQTIDQLAAWFPDHVAIIRYLKMLSYGYGWADACDMCGKELNIIEGQSHYMCHKCNDEHQANSQSIIESLTMAK